MSHTLGISPILIVEDDDDTRESLQELLELKGFRTLSAENGREGLRVLKEAGWACVILLDWMMPVMNGRQFLRAISSDARYRDIPVIVVTAFSGTDPGIPDRHLSKPVPVDVLVREVSAHCVAT